MAKLPAGPTFEFHNRTRFLPKIDQQTDKFSISASVADASESIQPGALRIIRWGQWDWPLVISTPERAILELIDELPNKETFHLVDVTMEGMVNVSPRRMQQLLEEATSIKVKRLFFFFADRHRHRWLEHIKRDKIDLGKGKRMLVKGGKLDPKYQITVPEDFYAIQ
jgi:hypothetical protein